MTYLFNQAIIKNNFEPTTRVNLHFNKKNIGSQHEISIYFAGILLPL